MAFVVAGSVLLSACQDEAPGCASDETRELISDIARSSQNNILVFRLRYSHADDGRYDDLDWDEYTAQLKTDLQNYDDNVVNGVYTLHDIKNRSTYEIERTANCVANLKFEIPGFGSEQMPVDYSVSLTSDGVLYGTLDGLTF